MFPPKIIKQNEVNFQQDASLLNIGVKNMPMLENARIKKKMKNLFDKEEIGSKTSSCGFHNVLASNMDCAW